MTDPDARSRDYPNRPNPFPHNQDRVYEPIDRRSVLVDRFGRPLVRPRQPLGFRPPQEHAR